MTGPEHYQHAESAVRQATHAPYLDATERNLYLTQAQVHATLALTAALAVQPAELGLATRQRQAWDAVVLPSLEWECQGCGAAMTTAPGGEVPDPAVCGPCNRSDDPWAVTVR